MVGESKPPPCLCLPRRCPRTLSARVPAVLGGWDGVGEPAEGLGAPCSISCIGTAEQAGGKRAVPVRGCTSRGRRPRGTPPGHPSASWWSLGETKTLHLCTLESCAGIQNIAMSMISPLGIAQGWQSHVCRREGYSRLYTTPAPSPAAPPQPPPACRASLACQTLINQTKTPCVDSALQMVFYGL